jgi:hypothetical protein
MKQLIIIDNAILPDHADSIERAMIKPEAQQLSKVAWYFGDYVVEPKCEEKETPKKNQYMFVHQFFDSEFGVVTNQENWNLIQPLRATLHAGSYLRIKANLYPVSNKVYTHGFHMDLPYMNVMSAIYFVNSNDGYAYFKGDKLIQVESIKNRLVIFPNGLLHSGTTCTDAKGRAVINFNYVCDPNHAHYKHYNT